MAGVNGWALPTKPGEDEPKAVDGWALPEAPAPVAAPVVPAPIQDDQEAVRTLLATPVTKEPTRASGLPAKAFDEAVGTRLGIDPENQEEVRKYTGILYPVVDALAGVGEGVGGGINAGIAKVVQATGNLFGARSSSTEEAAKAINEAFNIGSLFVGDAGVPGAVRAESVAPKLQEMFNKGASADELVATAKAAGQPIDTAAAEQAVNNRAKGVAVIFKDEAPKPEAVPSPSPEEEAAIAKAAPPVPEDAWATPEPIAKAPEPVAAEYTPPTEDEINRLAQDELVNKPATPTAEDLVNLPGTQKLKPENKTGDVLNLDEPAAGPYTADKYAANVNTDRLFTTDETRQYLGEATKDLDLGVQTHADTAAQAEDLLTKKSPLEILNYDPKASESPAHALAVRTLLVGATNKMADAAKLVLDSATDTSEARADLIKFRLMTAAAADKASGIASSAGRLLNQFNIVAGSDASSMAKAMASLEKEAGNKVDLDEFARMVNELKNDPVAQQRLAKASMKPYWEDYIIAARNGMMLSGPRTFFKNFADGGLNLAMEALAHHAAYPAGLIRGGADRVTAKELAARWYGAGSALMDAANYKKVGDAFLEGHPLTGISKMETGGVHLPGPLKVLETGPRLNSAADQFWRGIINRANTNGMAVRTAYKEGLTGKALQDRIDFLRENPTKEMLAHSNEMSTRLQFVDESSPFTQALKNAQARKPGMSGMARASRFLLKLAVPFPGVADSMLRTGLRWSPFGFADAATRKAIAAGGAERDIAISRMAIGSTALASVFYQTMAGKFTGEGPANPDKKFALQSSGWQPNSVLVNGKYHDISGTAAGQTVNMVAALAEKFKNGEISQDDYGTELRQVLAQMGRQMSNTSWFQDLGSIFQMAQPGQTGDNAVKNYAANLANSFVTPALVRQSNQAFFDDTQRDTSGNGDLSQILAGRMASAYPGLSSKLPPKYDAFGRPFANDTSLSGMRTSKPDEDLAVQEVSRLEAQQPGTLVGRAAKIVGLSPEARMKLNADDYENYQRLSGQYILETIRSEMQTPEWKKMDDADKRVEVTRIVDEMRKHARDTLFSGEDSGWATPE